MVKNLSIMILISMISLIGCKKYEDKYGYRDVTVITESTKRVHPWGKPIPIKVTVRNEGKKPFIFNTKGNPLRISPALPVTTLGLSDPRPVYDLIFSGRGYIWVWSQHAKESVPAEIVLQPGETKVLIETVWNPPTEGYMQGGFAVRFADVEFPTGIGIESPKR